MQVNLYGLDINKSVLEKKNQWTVHSYDIISI